MAKKVVLVCGSPHKDGCTRRALREVEKTLRENGVETETFVLGPRPVRGCVACNGCAETGVCVWRDEPYTELVGMLRDADGLVVGSPVYYAGPNGSLCALLDRVFYSAGDLLRGKPACAVVNCRRGGASAAFDRLNKYFTINEMPVVSSVYWNSTHGFTPEDVEKDEEGLQVMRALGRNLAALLALPPLSGCPEERTMTNFIR